MTYKSPQFRIALNSRCARACFFCRPSGEGLMTAAHTELPLDCIRAVASEVRAIGVRHVKLTGGDPALYGPLEDAVHMLRHGLGFETVEVISRHPDIGRRALALAQAGATQFNLSIDTLDPRKHRLICGIDDLEQVLGALTACISTGVPCKVNVVVMGGVNDDEIGSIVDAMAARGVETVKLLDVITDLDQGSESFARRLRRLSGATLEQLYMPLSMIADTLRRDAVEEGVRRQGDLGHPMTVFKMKTGIEVVIKDSTAGAWYGDMCHGCKFYPCHDALMALRLTADARLQFCLLREEIAVPLHPVIGDKDRLRRTINDAIAQYASATFHRVAPNASRSEGVGA